MVAYQLLLCLCNAGNNKHALFGQGLNHRCKPHPISDPLKFVYKYGHAVVRQWYNGRQPIPKLTQKICIEWARQFERGNRPDSRQQISPSGQTVMIDHDAIQ